MEKLSGNNSPAWARNVLYAAAIYNLCWGAAVIVAPMALFQWAGMEEPRYPQIWQCVGMIVGVYGIGYWIAAREPFRHWAIVAVGLVGKVLGPIGFLNAVLTGALPLKWGVTIVTNDLIWWIPFSAILYLAFRHHSNSSRGVPKLDFHDAIATQRSQRDATLLQISERRPVVVAFLRHSGCTFCRESLADLESQVQEIHELGADLAIVHMGSPMDGTMMLQKRRLDVEHHFSDPNCVLYQAFDLERGRFSQLFSPSIIVAGLRGVMKGYGIGPLAGDGFRMPGTFVLIDGKIAAQHRATMANDHCDVPALLEMALSESAQTSPLPVAMTDQVGDIQVAAGRSVT